MPWPSRPSRLDFTRLVGAAAGALGTPWAKGGHAILFSSRNPGTLKDLQSCGRS